MVRVLKPGGTLLIANINSFISACADVTWMRGADGTYLHYPVDNYLDERVDVGELARHPAAQLASSVEPLHEPAARPESAG